MNSHWFKFYGQDWLTDMKIIKMSSVDRLCYITLLCLASSTDDGVIKNCNEEAIIQLTHLPVDTSDEAKGFLQRLDDNKMITNDNNGNVSLINFLRRQQSNLTGYERVKRYREKMRVDTKKDINVINDNPKITLYKIREDKIREDKIRETKCFFPPTIEQVTEYIKSKNYSIDPEHWFSYYESNGWLVGKNKMKNWQAAIRTWVKKEWNKPRPKVETDKYNSIKVISI